MQAPSYIIFCLFLNHSKVGCVHLQQCSYLRMLCPAVLLLLMLGIGKCGRPLPLMYVPDCDTACSRPLKYLCPKSVPGVKFGHFKSKCHYILNTGDWFLLVFHFESLKMWVVVFWE